MHGPLSGQPPEPTGAVRHSVGWALRPEDDSVLRRRRVGGGDGGELVDTEALASRPRVDARRHECRLGPVGAARQGSPSPESSADADAPFSGDARFDVLVAAGT